MSTSGAILEKRDSEDPVEPLFAALEHIAKQGSLLRLAPDRAQRLGLMMAMTKQGLVAWNAAASKYELTSLGGERLAEYQQTIGLQASATR